jgi:autophagy-related protein 5
MMDNIIPQTLWAKRIPLHITHASVPSAPPLILAVPRFGYLALLFSRLAVYFGRLGSSFHYEGVLLRNLPIGLLVDLYRPQLPWRLVIDEGDAWDISDTFLNGVKEV